MTDRSADVDNLYKMMPDRQTAMGLTKIDIIPVFAGHVLDMLRHAGITSLQEAPALLPVLLALFCHGCCLVLQVGMQLGVPQLPGGVGSHAACTWQQPTSASFRHRDSCQDAAHSGVKICGCNNQGLSHQP